MCYGLESVNKDTMIHICPSNDFTNDDPATKKTRANFFCVGAVSSQSISNNEK